MELKIGFEYHPFLPNMKEQIYCPLECGVTERRVVKKKKIELHTFLLVIQKHFFDLFSPEIPMVILFPDLCNKPANLPNKHVLILSFAIVNLSKLSFRLIASFPPPNTAVPFWLPLSLNRNSVY